MHTHTSTERPRQGRLHIQHNAASMVSVCGIPNFLMEIGDWTGEPSQLNVERLIQLRWMNTITERHLCITFTLWCAVQRKWDFSITKRVTHSTGFHLEMSRPFARCVPYCTVASHWYLLCTDPKNFRSTCFAFLVSPSGRTSPCNTAYFILSVWHARE